MHGTQTVEPEALPSPSGPTVEVRPARPDDQAGVTAFVEGLSQRSRVLRFFTGLTRPDARLARTLVTVDDSRDILLALDDRGHVVGHVMGFLRGDVTEIAVVVADGWQGLGLGGRLVWTLLGRAAGRGAEFVQMDVMGENRKVLSIIGRWWPEAEVRVQSGTVEVRCRIGR
ncbi:GNAT family N-acetyltransferase [Sphaerisporangium fuscum]|uniref:GNAT family N-acetyltransferase n=1 Tax=Sphaerisporangium fuscum TaxID=2835868 RepID=UPI001BDD3704|nr:GNAT family N-acetyltransferase [Sphaerisporangium fuscum]